MGFIEDYQKKLNYGISFIEIIAYTISFLLISVSIFSSIIIYIKELDNPTKAFNDTRLDLHESIALALSFILGIEILKLFYISSYRQLVIIISLVAIKLLINYVLLEDIKKSITTKYIQ